MNEIPVVVLPAPAPVKLHNIKWNVQVDVKDDLTTKVWFSLTPGDYEKLSLNMAEILRWNREMKWQLRYYIEEAKPDELIDRGNGKSSEDDGE